MYGILHFILSALTLGLPPWSVKVPENLKEKDKREYIHNFYYGIRSNFETKFYFTKANANKDICQTEAKLIFNTLTGVPSKRRLRATNKRRIDHFSSCILHPKRFID